MAVQQLAVLQNKASVFLTQKTLINFLAGRRIFILLRQNKKTLFQFRKNQKNKPRINALLRFSANTYICRMDNAVTSETTNEMLSYEGFRNEVLNDYRLVMESREVSLIGRKEVLTGKAKFGIFGDGKELAQVALAKFFQPGDFRSGYYRDQTFMFATGLSTAEQIFAQLYADPDMERDPFSAGRQMNCHFATRMVNENGEWVNLAELKNISSDIAPTAGQMPRALGLAFASKSSRNIEE